MPLDVAFGSPLPAVSLTDGVVALRVFDERDLPIVEAASSDPHITEITTVPVDFSGDAGRAYIDRQNERLTSGQGWSLAIVDAVTDVSVGQIGLWISQLSKGRADIGYWIAPAFRQRGAAAAALALLADWAFDQLDVDRLSLYVEPWNEASVKTAERAGFAREGVLRGWERIGGEAKDMVPFALLRRDR